MLTPNMLYYAEHLNSHNDVIHGSIHHSRAGLTMNSLDLSLVLSQIGGDDLSVLKSMALIELMAVLKGKREGL